MKNSKSLKEFNIIKNYFLPLTNSNKFAENLADDVARIDIEEDEELLISKDIFVENKHFLLQNGGFLIAQKLLLTNLSDIAASGGKPICYLMGFSKFPQINQKFCKEFTKGLKSVQDEYQISLIGGDLVASSIAFFSITIFGTIKKGASLKRSDAKAGDLIFVSGNVGDAGLGLKISTKGITKSTTKGITKIKSGDNPNKLAKKYEKFLLNRHFCPSPRVKLGEALVAKQISKCAIDISDGLLADLRNICKASNLEAEIYLPKIPISLAAELYLKKNKSVSKLDLLSFGDDYELIFTVKSSKRAEIQKLALKLNLKITEIGQMKEPKKNPIISIFSENNDSAKKQKIRIKKFGFEH